MANRQGSCFANAWRARRGRGTCARLPHARISDPLACFGVALLLAATLLVAGCAKGDRDALAGVPPEKAATPLPAAPSVVFAGRQLQHQPLPCASAILIEPESNAILYEQDAHTLRAPASIVKMTLELVVLREIEAGRLALTDSIRVSEWASNIGGSQVYLAAGEVFPLEELMKAIVIHSANDACVAVAEHIAGTADGFVELMNREVEQLGLTDTHYINVHGLDDDPGAGNRTTAYDIAQIGRALIRYPKVLEWSSIEKTPFRSGDFILENTNKLIGRFEGCDGLKTGFTDTAGFCLCATAKRNGLRLISVVMGCNANRDRFAENAELLAAGFNSYSLVAGLTQGADLKETVRVRDGDPKQVAAVGGPTTTVLVSRPDDRTISRRFVPLAKLRAPLAPGDRVGTIQVLSGERVLAELPAVTLTEVRMNGFAALVRSLTGK
ncbi:MAG: D-alanyl-D-alanine carboxypeptidase family protein [Candidatus Eisenbacteria bacterium]